jgi:hypothetical protein
MHPTFKFLLRLGCIPIVGLKRLPKGANVGDQARLVEYQNRPLAKAMFYVPVDVAVKLMAAYNGSNRKKNDPTITKLITDLQTGTWRPYMEFVRFRLDDPTVVCDGQHRLTAILRAMLGAIVMFDYDFTDDDVVSMTHKNPDKLYQVIGRVLPQPAPGVMHSAKKLQQYLGVIQLWLNPGSPRKPERADVSSHRYKNLVLTHLDDLRTVVDTYPARCFSSKSWVHTPLFAAYIQGALTSKQLLHIRGILVDRALPCGKRYRVFQALRDDIDELYGNTQCPTGRSSSLRDQAARIVFCKTCEAVLRFAHHHPGKKLLTYQGSASEVLAFAPKFGKVRTVPEAWGK